MNSYSYYILWIVGVGVVDVVFVAMEFDLLTARNCSYHVYHSISIDLVVRIMRVY